MYIGFCIFATSFVFYWAKKILKSHKILKISNLLFIVDFLGKYVKYFEIKERNSYDERLSKFNFDLCKQP